MTLTCSPYLKLPRRTEAEYLAERAPYCGRCRKPLSFDPDECKDVNCPYWEGSHRP